MKTLRDSTPGVSRWIGRAGLALPALTVAVLATVFVPARGNDGMEPISFSQLSSPVPISSMPGQVVQPLAGQIVRPLPGQIVGVLPGQLVPVLPGQVVPALPGQITGSLANQRVYSLTGFTIRSVSGAATYLQPNPIRPPKSGH